MEKKLKILHLEDLPTDAELVARELKKGNIEYEKLVVDTREEFLHALHEFKPDIILSDHSLPSFNSKEALKIVKETAAHIPFILITATVSEEFAVEIMKEGACDYILKDRLQRLPSAVMSAMQMYELAAERQKFLDAVIENEALMTEAEKLAHFGSWEVNMETGISKWSAEAFRIHGYKQEKNRFSFDHFFENVHEEDFKRLKNMLRNTFERHRSLLKLDYRLKVENEPDRYVVSELVIKYNAEGKPSRINGFSQDITERKKNEDELRAAAERKKEEEILRKNLKQISDFVRHASHELRTPLATMLLQTENALKKNLTEEESKKVLESLKEDQLRMIDLTNALLMLSKYDEENASSNWPVLRIDELIYEAIVTAKKTFSDISINFNFSPIDLNETYLLLSGNESLLLTAFGNLIKNAYLYSDDKKVAIHLEANEKSILVFIENAGKVLKASEREKIFLPMVRGENAVQTKGFGLGLSIVKRVAALHHGTVHYEAVNQNTNRFTLSFFTGSVA